MERRLLVAILLTFIVLTVYQWMMPTPPLQPGAKPGTIAGAGAASTAPSGATQGSPASVAPPAPALPPVETVLADTAERRIAVDNGLVHAVFSNRGGVLASWQLMQYHD